MLPIRDDLPCFTTPWVTYFLIASNLVIYFLESMLTPRGQEVLLTQFALIPRHVELGLTGQAGGLPGALLPLLTSMFLHGGWMHVLGNMWVLWIFGDNIEDHLGRLPYLIFYLTCGFAAAVLHVLLNWGSRVPTVGASGAIAGVMGAFLLLYPQARVYTLWVFFVVKTRAWVAGLLDCAAVPGCCAVFSGPCETRRHRRHCFLGSCRRVCCWHRSDQDSSGTKREISLRSLVDREDSVAQAIPADAHATPTQ